MVTKAAENALERQLKMDNTVQTTPYTAMPGAAVFSAAQ